MTATVPLCTLPTYTAGWQLNFRGSDGIEYRVAVPPGISIEWRHPRFGSVTDAVVLHADGTPNFDRPMYREAPAVNAVVWGRGSDGAVRIAIIRQPRPHPDDPRNPDVIAHLPVVFGQIPMGFIEQLIGENAEQAAAREAHEEAGASAVRSVTRPQYPMHCPNPTMFGSWTDVVFVEVDLDRIEALKPDRNEPIYSAEYVTVQELLARVRAGEDEAGAVYRGGTSLSALMIFFATYPELWP